MAIRVLSTLARRIVWTGAMLASLTSMAAAQTPFKIGISAPVVNILPVWMGEAGGFYGKEGLQVEVINMEGGTRGLQVLLSGEIQAMHVGLAPVVLANKQGADFRLITSSVNTIPITMFAKPGITMKDLKGKNIGISTFGSETDIAVSILLKQQNLTRQDVTVTQIGGSSQRFAALVAGRIDVAPLIEPAISQAIERGLSPLIDLAAAKTPWIFRFGRGFERISAEEPRYAHALRESLCCRRLSGFVDTGEGERSNRATLSHQGPEGHRRDLQ